MENNEKNAKKIEKKIETLKKTLDEIQKECPHTNYTIKYLLNVKSPKRVCDECNKDIGYASDQELKDSGFM